MVWSVGDVESPILPRSCNKPIQALGMVRAGLDLPPDLLALACASHSGEPFHIEGVRRILASAGLSEADLQTPPDYPLDDAAREQVIREGGSKAPVLMNCSGKHAAMLATCAANGWPTETYLDPEHPVQQAIAATFAELTGEPVAVTAVDGCGAPLLSASLSTSITFGWIRDSCRRLRAREKIGCWRFTSATGWCRPGTSSMTAA